MRIVIARHAKAEDGDGKPDADRNLVPEGIEQSKVLGRLLAATLLHVDELWTSPLNRAVQTADTAGGILKVKPKTVEELAIGGDLDHLCWLMARSKSATLMVVGHQPDLGQLSAKLLGLQSPIVLKKSGVTIIDTRDASKPVGRAVATLKPEQYQEILDGKEYVPWMVRKQLL